MLSTCELPPHKESCPLRLNARNDGRNHSACRNVCRIFFTSYNIPKPSGLFASTRLPDIKNFANFLSFDHSQRCQADLNFHQVTFRSNDIFNIFVRLRSFGKIQHLPALAVTGHRMPAVANDALHGFVTLGSCQRIAGNSRSSLKSPFRLACEVAPCSRL